MQDDPQIDAALDFYLGSGLIHHRAVQIWFVPAFHLPLDAEKRCFVVRDI